MPPPVEMPPGTEGPATPNSVTTNCTSVRGAVTRPLEIHGTILETPRERDGRQRHDRPVAGEHRTHHEVDAPADAARLFPTAVPLSSADRNRSTSSVEFDRHEEGIFGQRSEAVGVQGRPWASIAGLRSTHL